MWLIKKEVGVGLLFDFAQSSEPAELKPATTGNPLSFSMGGKGEVRSMKNRRVRGPDGHNINSDAKK